MARCAHKWALIGAHFEVDPTVLKGRAKFTAVGFLELDGRFLAAFPSGAAPYRLSTDDLPGLPQNLQGADFVDPVFGVGGTLRITNLPIAGDIDLASAYLVYGWPGNIAFGGHVDKDFFGIVDVHA